MSRLNRKTPGLLYANTLLTFFIVGERGPEKKMLTKPDSIQSSRFGIANAVVPYYHEPSGVTAF
jgi:hypothetical protein